MRIGVCFKIHPDFGQVDKKDWEIKSPPGRAPGPELAFARKIFNGFEESALELALTLADRLRDVKTDIDLSAVTVDDHRADLFLKQLSALGYDPAMRVETRLDYNSGQTGDPDRDKNQNQSQNMDMRFSPLALSCILTAWTNRMGDIRGLIFGARSAQGDNGQTGFYTAERLGWPCIRSVTDILPGPDKQLTLTVHSRSNGCLVSQTVALPVVLIVDNTETAPYLRVPTLVQKMAAARKKINIISLCDLGLEPTAQVRMDPVLKKLSLKKKERACQIISGTHCREKAKIVYEQFIKPRLKT